MFAEFDPFLDFNCPYCQISLRWRRVKKLHPVKIMSSDNPIICPDCEGKLVERCHPAIANNWLWSRFYIPGVILCAMGIFIPSIGWILPFALVTLAFGFIALIAYMIHQRWNWKVYVKPEDKI